MRFALACLTAVMVSGCSAPSSVASEATGAVSGEPRLPGQSALVIFPNGFDADGRTLRNGSSIALGSGLSAEVFVDPYPATGPNVWLDILLMKDGQSVTSAQVSSETEMAYMNHGTAHIVSSNAGSGHYVFNLNYPMIGPWRNRIDISVAGEHHDLPLAVTVYPS